MRALFAYLAALGAVAQPVSARAQTQSLDAAFGAWHSGAMARLWTAGVTRGLPGPFDYAVALSHLDDRASLVDRTQTGGELSLGLGRDGSGVYMVGSVGLAMKHSDGNIDAAWSTGAGASLRLLPFLALGVEGRYRAEDQFSHGFWGLDASDRRGWVALARVSFLLHSVKRTARALSAERPSRRTVEDAAQRSGLTRSELAGQVVMTALDVMGTPYQWGGSDGNGYDCSGLIQFAYEQHGIAVPRMSRDQAVFGRAIERNIDRLAPGDILGFTLEGDRISHVGLYVGNGQFIHSASSGVKLSNLRGTDPDSLWWQHRWAVVRRVVE